MMGHFGDDDGTWYRIAFFCEKLNPQVFDILPFFDNRNNAKNESSSYFYLLECHIKSKYNKIGMAYFASNKIFASLLKRIFSPFTFFSVF